MIICLLGKSLAGKTSLQNLVVEKLGFKHIRLVTTRHKRQEEADRQCISDKEFDKLILEGKFAYHYNWRNDKRYGILAEDLEKAKSGRWIVNLDYNPNIVLQFLEASLILLEASPQILEERNLAEQRFTKESFMKRVNPPTDYYSENLDIVYARLNTSENLHTTFMNLGKMINKIVSSNDPEEALIHETKD